jgi:quercetin dioxygenase-like cupin family protein
MTVVPAATRRRHTTPNATMTTLASPTQGGAGLSLWLVDMPAGATGPWHAFDAEVLWALTAGSGVLEIGAEQHPLGPGDTAVLPGGVPRRLLAGPDGFTAVATTTGVGEVTREDGTSAGVPPWVS